MVLQSLRSLAFLGRRVEAIKVVEAVEATQVLPKEHSFVFFITNNG